MAWTTIIEDSEDGGLCCVSQATLALGMTTASEETVEATADRNDFRLLLVGVSISEVFDSAGTATVVDAPPVIAGSCLRIRRSLATSLLRSVRGVICFFNLRSIVLVTGGNATERCTKAERGASSCCLEGVLSGVAGNLC